MGRIGPQGLIVVIVAAAIFAGCRTNAHISPNVSNLNSDGAIQNVGNLETPPMAIDDIPVVENSGKTSKSLVVEAEKEWPKYWQLFQTAVTAHDKEALRSLMYIEIGCSWGYQTGQEPRDGCLEHFEKDGQGVWNLGYSLRRVVQPGGRAKIRGASEKIYKAKSIRDSTIVAQKGLWTQDKLGCTAQFDFEFRTGRWQWTYFASGCD